MVESHELKPGVYVGRTLFPTEHRDLKVCMANTTNKTQLIAPGTCLGHGVSAIVVSDETPVSADSDGTPAVADDTLESVFVKLPGPGDVTSDQRQRVADLLSEYDDLFSRGTFDMGRTNLVEHTIDTGSNRPIRESLRRHPRAQLDDIDRQVDELLLFYRMTSLNRPQVRGLLNVVLVKRKDGSFRLCVDYRRLDPVSYKDSYPLPHIDTCLGSMNGAV